jgi:hypothetical protein
MITVGFSTARNDLMLFARGIELIEKRPFSHVFIKYIDPNSGIEMVFQASHGMVNHMSLARFESSNTIIKMYDLDFNQDQFNKFYIFMLLKLGTPYGWLTIASIFISKIFRINCVLTKGLTTEICSQLGAEVCRIKNIPMPDITATITPSKLDVLLQDAGYKPVFMLQDQHQ